MIQVPSRKIAQPLTVTLVALLTIALLPLGVISVLQTFRVVSDADTQARREMQARTMEAARAEVSLINEAQGAAQALGAAATLIGSDHSTCKDIMRQFVEADGRFVFAGYVGSDGVIRCSSDENVIDFSGHHTWQAFAEDPKPRIAIDRNEASSGLAVMTVSVPFFARDGEFRGVATVSIPHSLLDVLIENDINELDVAIVAGSGAILSTSGGDIRFPKIDFAPGELDIPVKGRVLEVSDGTLISIIPLPPFDIFVVGTWSADAGSLPDKVMGQSAAAFPVVMWMASMFVAIFALERLVLRHLRVLRGHMRRFSVDNLEGSYVRLEDAPKEITEIAASYNGLLDRVIDDAINLAETAEQKEVLLKEVHHRVKNNLQLIASILNMQIRQIDTPEGQAVLKRVQQRVMSLAAIHKLLYSEEKVEVVRADLLLTDIVNTTIALGEAQSGGSECTLSIEPVQLAPDQAVPLALLLTESVTNALKYSGAEDGSAGQISVSLSESGAGEVSLEVCNTIGPRVETTSIEDGSGLGSKLIRAFVTQLEGEVRTEIAEGRYMLSVGFSKHAVDASRAA